MANTPAQEAAVLAQKALQSAQPTIDQPLFLGESTGFWIQTTAIVLTAFFAAWAVFSARQMTRKKNAADVIFSSKHDHELDEGMRVLHRINADENHDVGKYAYDAHSSTDEARQLRYVLNYWEYVAVGIRRGIYDEFILKDSKCNTLIHLYRNAEPFIQNVRRTNRRDTIYCELERLAKRWRANPINNHQKPFWKFWGGE